MSLVDTVSSVNRMGRILLRSGAETYRTEAMIQRVCDRFGLEAQCFVSVTCIITSIKTKDNNIISAVEKIQSISNNLNRIDRIHDLVLNIQDYDLCEFDKKIREIEAEQVYSEIVTVICHFFAAGSFCLLFKGNAYDFIVAGVGGIMVYFVSKLSARLRLNNFFLNTFCGFLATIFAAIMTRMGVIQTPSHASIGTIMLLVPGLVLTNAIRDLVSGDLISGLSRAAEAALVGSALGIGTFFSLFLMANWGY